MIIITRSGYILTSDDLNKLATLNHEPWQYTSYQPSPVIGVSLTSGQKNKVPVSTTQLGITRGFDLFDTGNGITLRFIGTGLGNGDIAKFSFMMTVSSESSNLSSELTYRIVKRHYTETNFQNTTNIPEAMVPRTITNNKIGALTIIGSDVELSDGDLLELNVETSVSLEFNLNALTFTITEKHDN